jgi:uncharacterized protein
MISLTSFSDFITIIVSILFEAFPFLVLGTLFTYLANRYIPEKMWYTLVHRNAIIRRLTLTFLGALLPVCECGNIPLVRRLIDRGIKPAEAWTFLLASPVVNPVSIIATYQAFASDHKVVYLRILGAILIANLVPWFIRSDSSEHIQNITKLNAKKSAAHEVSSLLPSLLLGASIAAAIQVLLPREILLQFASDPLLGLLAMLILAFIVSICSSVDAFFALAFVGVFDTNAIIAFLVFGPMIDIKILSMLRTTFSTKYLAKAAIVTLLLNVIYGIGLSYVV